MNGFVSAVFEKNFFKLGQTVDFVFFRCTMRLCGLGERVFPPRLASDRKGLGISRFSRCFDSFVFKKKLRALR